MAFVAQRMGMDYVGPFTFNAARFALGGLTTLVYLLLRNKLFDGRKILPTSAGNKTVLLIGGLAGALIFLASSFQQIGLVYTTAGKAGFITGLYVVIVPILGLVWGQGTQTGTWLGTILAVIGLYFLSVAPDFKIASGDSYVLLSAFFWAGHVHVVGRYSERIGAIRLATFQFFINAVLSFMAALWLEEIDFSALLLAVYPILYTGLLSVGLGYTLQIVAQRDAHPSHAAIILSLETVFAALGGWIFLRELFGFREVIGGGLMFAGMLISVSSYMGVSRSRLQRFK